MAQKLIILFGGSCSAKTTTEKFLVENFLCSNLTSMTTRAPRFGEINEVDYHFVDEFDFNCTEKLNKIEITPEWLYGVSVSEFMRHQDLDIVYSVINIDLAIDLINNLRKHNRIKSTIEIVIVNFDIPTEDRVKCMKTRGMSDEEIEFRLSREDPIDSAFDKLINVPNVRYEVYSDSLNPSTQEGICKLIYK